MVAKAARKRRLRYIHWKSAEARERVAFLRAAGYVVDASLPDQPFARKLKSSPPHAVVIDLGRLPGQGRDIGLAVRNARATRHIPIVFVDGDPDKLPRIRKSLPDAVYSPWRRIRSAISLAMAHPPAEPVKVDHILAGYSGTPLPKKLGIKSGMTVGLVGAPKDFDQTLGYLPDGVQLKRQPRNRTDLVLWFVIATKDLRDRIRRMGDAFEAGGLWIIWPKKASGVNTDLTQQIVRETGLAAGLVDYKICAVDDTWSGLKFARRKEK